MVQEKRLALKSRANRGALRCPRNRRSRWLESDYKIVAAVKEWETQAPWLASNHVPSLTQQRNNYANFPEFVVLCSIAEMPVDWNTFIESTGKMEDASESKGAREEMEGQANGRKEREIEKKSVPLLQEGTPNVFRSIFLLVRLCISLMERIKAFSGHDCPFQWGLKKIQNLNHWHFHGWEDWVLQSSITIQVVLNL